MLDQIHAQMDYYTLDNKRVERSQTTSLNPTFHAICLILKGIHNIKVTYSCVEAVRQGISISKGFHDEINQCLGVRSLHLTLQFTSHEWPLNKFRFDIPRIPITPG